MMALFRFGKKKEEKKTASCTCHCGYDKMVTEMTEDVYSIKVLGSGCRNCHDLFEAAKKAVHNLGLSVEVEYVTDMEKVMAYGVMRMPALVVNEKVVSMGRVLNAADVEELIRMKGC